MPADPGECNRCGKHKENILGLCEHCHRFPKPETKQPFNAVRRPIDRDFKF